MEEIEALQNAADSVKLPGLQYNAKMMLLNNKIILIYKN